MKLFNFHLVPSQNQPASILSGGPRKSREAITKSLAILTATFPSRADLVMLEAAWSAALEYLTDDQIARATLLALQEHRLTSLPVPALMLEWAQRGEMPKDAF